ncbi:hydroxyacylglutathione mitochondrial [Nannochloropsis gaditana]|uniref:hydroxyacylglutathione hydrolase n=1 Tax=Nannochloropsis gaditana TaxID=72520 RepID=W7TSB8_9STRA|nr:hydroxyacylglutathione mitochondrial [Nannochloropsis gaditana]
MHDRPLLVYAPSRALFVVLTGSFLLYQALGAAVLLTRTYPFGVKYHDSRPSYGRSSFVNPPMLSSLRPLLHSVTGMGTLAAAGTSSPPASSCSTTPALPPCARVIPVPILSDNFAYLVVDPQTGKAACVDPAEPAKVLAAAQREGIKLSTLLCTHKHWDHAGGNEEMARMLPGLEVVTTKFEDIPAATIRLGDDDVYTLGSLSVRALYTPCHTKGHVLFLVTPQDEAGPGTSPTAPVLFSGDTLFVGGCGRFFEGDGAQMVEALMGRVASLSPETLVYCGHEYTQSNLAFAMSVEPENAALRAKIAVATAALRSGQPTVPSTVGSELEINPFMRVGEAAVIKAAREKGGAAGEDPVSVMTALREMKNIFKG